VYGAAIGQAAARLMPDPANPRIVDAGFELFRDSG
jgi:hypothetical protein